MTKKTVGSDINELFVWLIWYLVVRHKLAVGWAF